MAKSPGNSPRRKRPDVPLTPLDSSPSAPRGSLLIIGGNENKEGHRPILEELARRAGSGTLIVATLATEEPQEQWQQYQELFRDMGVRRVVHLDARRREELLENPRVEMLDDAKVVFFAGGDQLKITSKFGGTQLCDRVRKLYEDGGTIARHLLRRLRHE